MDEAIWRVVEQGQGTIMAKFDIESAYRLVPPPIAELFENAKHHPYFFY